MVDIAVISIVLSAVSTTAIGLFALLRKIRVFKSCCCQSECMNDNMPEEIIELPHIPSNLNMNSPRASPASRASPAIKIETPPQRRRQLPVVPRSL